MSNDTRLHELSATYFNAVRRHRRIEANEEAGDDAAADAALDQAEAAAREAASIVAATAAGAAAQLEILRDVAKVFRDDPGEVFASGRPEAQMLDRVLEAHGHQPLFT